MFTTITATIMAMAAKATSTLIHHWLAARLASASACFCASVFSPLDHRLFDLSGDRGLLRVGDPLVVLVRDRIGAGGGAVAFRVALRHG